MIENLEKKSLHLLNRLLYHGKTAPRKAATMPAQALNDYIRDAFLGDKPVMIARFGSGELDAGSYPYILSLPLLKRYGLYAKRKISYLRADKAIEGKFMYALCNNAGFFPNDVSLLDRYSRLMTEDAGQLDCLCCSPWINEDVFEKFYAPGIIFSELNYMEPYDYANPWSAALKGKKVLVVHPFADTIRSQYARREKLWANPDVLPEFTLHTLKAVQSVAGQKTEFATWFDALEHMKAQMDSTDYDIAIIGCGAYGFHLAAHAKRSGHKAIHLGGATQILFGIRGRRWDEMPAVSKFYNEYWTRPSAEETPQGTEKVEGSCYW